MKRLPDWRRRLERFVDEAERTPFAWGAADCGPDWAGRAIEAVLGIDIAARYRGRYASVTEALRLLREAEVKSLGDLVGRLLEQATGANCEIHPSAARFGDIMAVPDGGPFVHTLGICNGERILVRRADGKGTVERTAATRAWRLGHA